MVGGPHHDASQPEPHPRSGRIGCGAPTNTPGQPHVNHPAEARAVSTSGAPRSRPKILILTSSLLTDRMLAPTAVLEQLGADAEVRVLATSMAAESDGAWPPNTPTCSVEAFPPVATVRFFPAGLLQELTDIAWETRHRPISRVDRARDGFAPRSRPRLARVGAALGRLGAAVPLEVLATLAARRRTVPPEVEAELETWRPDLTVVTNPFHSYETGVAAAAQRRGSRVIALIPSWDNLTTKRRMVFDYDGYLVWSDDQAASLRRLYPRAVHRPVDVVGTPQYDAFVDPRFHADRGEWCARHGLDPHRPIVLYALGSPNMFDELPAVATVANAADRGDLEDAQVLVRCHPIHDTEQLARDLAVLVDESSAVTVQRSAARPDSAVRERTHGLDELVDWVNTFRHADVVVNLSSTSTLDAAIFDRPVVNLDYDPAPGGRRTPLVKEINRLWEHFAPVAQSGGVALVSNPDELLVAVQRALREPAIGHDGRAWIVRTVAGPVDGKAGVRLAEAILRHSNDHHG